MVNLLSEQILHIVTSISNDEVVKKAASIITLLTICIGIFISVPAALILYTSYILGIIVSWNLIKYKKNTGVYLQRLISLLYHGRLTGRSVLRQSCSICDNSTCRRHQQSKSAIPWQNLLVQSDLNNSVEHFYERIVTNFISSWYEQFTDDEDFKAELRYCFRFSTSTIIKRFLELDVSKIITDNLLPCMVRHIDDYLYMQQIGKLKNVRFDEVVLEYLGKRLHPAATNRNNELGYLRNVTSALLPHILPDACSKCRNYSVMMREILAGWVLLPLMDVIADPNIINSLTILIATYKPKKNSKTNRNVDVLEYFHSDIDNNQTSSSFAMTLNTIKKKADLLYAFMQFLKKYDHVNMLQFCLDVDDFNAKLLMPDLSKKQLDELHSDAQKLYREYLFEGSFSCINCPSEISESFQRVMKNPDKLLELSKLLYTAYDHTFNSLENEWLPQFFHSNEFYEYICGSRRVPQCTKQLSNKSSFGSPIKDRSRRYESTNQGSSKINSGLVKIRGVLKPNQPIEGSFPVDPQSIENGIAEDIFLGECKSLFRDLSTWKVSIPTYQTSPSKKVIYFCVNIEHPDAVTRDKKKEWVVLRKDQDFYTLKSKLVEFHGETEICDSPLPSRKTGSPIETRMVKYEEFLKRLLQKSTLKGSDLLHYFLTTEEDFTIYIAQNAANIQDIGNIYQSVAYKLRKERGQYLDSFMMSFLTSTGIRRNENLELAEVGEEIDSFSISSHTVRSPKTYRNHIFNDNFGVQYNCLRNTNSESFSPEGVGESIFYLLKHIFKLPTGILKLYASVCTVAQYSVELTSRMIIERGLKCGLGQSNLAHLIKLLEDIVFDPHISATKEELKKRQMRAFQELNKSVPLKLTKIFGNGVKDGYTTLLEVLQHPHFNKQLAYNLFDIVLLEIYPNLGKNEG